MRSRIRACGLSRVLQAALLALIAGPLHAQTPQVSDAAGPWAPELSNPKPAPGDLVLPMPCGGAMAFRPIEVPSKDLVDDERVRLGAADPQQGFKENLRDEFLAGGFSNGARPGTRRIYLAKYELTQLQLAALKASAAGAPCPKPGPDARLPAVSVTWFEVMSAADAYTSWLIANAKDKLPAEAGQPGFVRLPTEAEWEFAARGGMAVPPADFTQPTFPTKEGGLPAYVFFGGSDSSNNELQWTGLLKPNPLGLHDMLGNAAELSMELFRIDRYGRAHGQAGGFVARGGDYLTPRGAVRTAAREEFPPYDLNGPRRAKTVGARFAIMPPVLPNPERLREIRNLWERLPLSSTAKPEEDPVKEAAALAEAASDPATRARLEELGAKVERTVATFNQERDRAARSTLGLATTLARVIRATMRQVLVGEETIALAGAAGAADAKLKQRVDERRDELDAQIAVYRDTMKVLGDDYAAQLRQQQAVILRQELAARGAESDVALLAKVEADLAASGKTGVPSAEAVVEAIRRELCRGDLKNLKNACKAGK